MDVQSIVPDPRPDDPMVNPKRGTAEGPTRRIRLAAMRNPEHQIRWRHALNEYIKGSTRAAHWERLRRKHHHISLRHILGRHFRRVRRGVYKLKHPGMFPEERGLHA